MQKQQMIQMIQSSNDWRIQLHLLRHFSGRVSTLEDDAHIDGQSILTWNLKVDLHRDS